MLNYQRVLICEHNAVHAKIAGEMFPSAKHPWVPGSVPPDAACGIDVGPPFPSSQIASGNQTWLENPLEMEVSS